MQCLVTTVPNNSITKYRTIYHPLKYYLNDITKGRKKREAIKEKKIRYTIAYLSDLVYVKLNQELLILFKQEAVQYQQRIMVA